MSRLKALESYFERIARTFSKGNIQVVVRGDRCYTSETTIHLPENIDRLDGDTRKIAEGMLDHEWSHHSLALDDRKKNRDDIFTVGKEIKNEDPDLISWINVYDDIRIEQKCKWHGVIINLDTANKALRKKLKERKAKGEIGLDKAPKKFIGCGIISRCLDSDTEWMGPKTNEILEEISDIIDAAKRGIDTLDDVIDLARKTRQRLTSLYNKELKKKIRSQKKGKSDEYLELSDFPLKEDVTQDPLKELVEEIITQESSEDFFTNNRYIADPLVVELDRISVPKHIGDFNLIGKNIQDKARVLKTKLISLIKAKSLSRTIGDQKRGKLDPSAYYSVASGNKRIFTKKIEGMSQDVAISLLVDCSGSMGFGDKMKYAKEVAAILGEALDILQIKFWIGSFCTRPTRMVNHRLPYTRFEPYEHMVYKGFHESWKRNRGRLVYMTASGNNDDGGSVRWAARELAKQNVSRHILFVISDGIPSTYNVEFNILNMDLRNAINEIISAGIEVIGIGIESNAVKKFYPLYIVIYDLHNFVPKVVDVLKQLLTGGKQWKRLTSST